MIGFTTKITAAKGGFFDRAAVQLAMDRRAAVVLSGLGAFVRQRARSSIRSPGVRKRASSPGKPPYNQTGVLRNSILFWYDQTQQQVTIGPVALNRPSPRWVMGESKPTPAVLEHGGTLRVHEVQVGGRWWKVSPSDPWLTRGKMRFAMRRERNLTIAPRPYMQPALEKTLGNPREIMKLWRKAIRVK